MQSIPQKINPIRNVTHDPETVEATKYWQETGFTCSLPCIWHLRFSAYLLFFTMTENCWKKELHLALNLFS